MLVAPLQTLMAAELVKSRFDLVADTAEKSLKAFSAQSGREVLFSSAVAAGVRTNAVKGDFTPDEAAERMLVGTPLRLVADKNGVMRAVRTTNEGGGAKDAPNARQAAPSDRSTESIKKTRPRIHQPKNR